MNQIELSCHVSDHSHWFIYDLEFKVKTNSNKPNNKELYQIRTQIIEQLKQLEGVYEILESDGDLDIWLVDDKRVPYYNLTILNEETKNSQIFEYNDLPEEDKYIFDYMKGEELKDEYSEILEECGAVLPLEQFLIFAKVQNEHLAKNK